jgi:hypothetical protein
MGYSRSPPCRQFARLAFRWPHDVHEESGAQVSEVFVAPDLEHPVILPIVAEHRIHHRALLDDRLDRHRESWNDRLKLLRKARRLGEIGDNEPSHVRQCDDRFSEIAARWAVEVKDYRYVVVRIQPALSLL